MRGTNKSAEALLSNQKTLRVCTWIKTHGRFPFIESSDIYERKMARFIVNRIRARKNKGTLTWYKTDQDIADANGCPDLFMTHFERDSNKNMKQLCEWIKKNGTVPNVNSKDKKEATLSRFLTAKKSAGRVGTATIYESDKRIAESYGFHNLFELSQEMNSNKKVHDLCLWIKSNGRSPDDESTEEAERVLGRFLEYKKDVNRKAKHGSGRKGHIYDSDLEIAKSYNMPDLFKIYTNEERSNARIKSLCAWIVANKRTPKNNAADPVEDGLSRILYKLRKDCNSNHFFDSDIEIIDLNRLNGLQKLKFWKKNTLYLAWKGNLSK
ncbi:MAG TPA: hypothetical protein VMW42_01885 [Desulfatiglandales bacterium]|nr:hypothetical protein [Desulfatiglandales bacterium]